MTKQHLLAYIEHMTPEQLEYFGNLLHYFHYGSMSDVPDFLKTMCGVEDTCDYAIPQQWADYMRRDHRIDPVAFVWRYGEFNGIPCNWPLELIRQACTVMKFQ
jgi:hypothetical protein